MGKCLKRNNMIKNIIFDWSGTLSNDLPCVYGATMNVFKKLGLKTLSMEEYREKFFLPYMNFYRKFTNLSKKELDKMFLEEIIKIGEPKPFSESRGVLEFLNRKNFKMAILSSYFQEKLESEVKNYGFQKFFTDINGGIHNKIKAIKKVMEKNDFAFSETAYVGDMTHDIDAGKAADALTVAVCWGYQSREKLSAKNPDFLIDNFKEIKTIFS